MPPHTTLPTSSPLPAPRTPEQQSWGTMIALVIIIVMVVVGAFYAWGKKIAEERSLIPQTGTSTQTY